MGTRSPVVALAILFIVVILFGSAASKGNILGFEDYALGLLEEELVSQE